MRGFAIACMFLILAGCGDRRSFDERYQDTEERLEAKARTIEANLATDQLNSDEAAGEGKGEGPSEAD